MAGKNVVLTRTIRLKNKRRNAGEKVQADAKLLAELQALNAVDEAAPEKEDKGE